MSEQINFTQTVNATIATAGSLMMAFQTAARWAILEKNMSVADVDQLFAKVAASVDSATTEGFSESDALQGKSEAKKLIGIVEDAIRKELAAR